MNAKITFLHSCVIMHAWLKNLQLTINEVCDCNVKKNRLVHNTCLERTLRVAERRGVHR